MGFGKPLPVPRFTGNIGYDGPSGNLSRPRCTVMPSEEVLLGIGDWCNGDAVTFHGPGQIQDWVVGLQTKRGTRFCRQLLNIITGDVPLGDRQLRDREMNELTESEG